jgi:hypothetical protein
MQHAEVAAVDNRPQYAKYAGDVGQMSWDRRPHWPSALSVQHKYEALMKLRESPATPCVVLLAEQQQQ